jgi:hypothetical protein
MTILFLIPYAVALAFLAAEMSGRIAKREWRMPQAPAWVWVAVLVATYAVQMLAARYAATHNPMSAIPLPIPVVFPGMDRPDALAFVFVALAAVQSLALVGLYRKHIAPSLLVAGCSALLILSICAPVLTSFDLYGYVHNALLGRAAWLPYHVPFQGEYAAIDRWFGVIDARNGTPSSALYGPLWFPIVQSVMLPMPTLLAKILAYRVFSAGAFVALIVLLRALGLPQRLVAAAALNPALAFAFVANAHNDLLAIAVVAGAAVAVRRSFALAGLLLVVAASIKLPYAVLGLPVIACIEPIGRRIAGAAIVVAASAALSWLGGGSAYVQSLSRWSGSSANSAWHLVPLLAALALVAAALFGFRRLKTAVWTIPVIGAFRQAFVPPWYLVFGLPYALGRHNVLRYLLISYPFAAAIVTAEFMRVWTLFLLFPLALVFSLKSGPRVRPVQR